MLFLSGLLLSFANLILGTLFWWVFKTSALIDKTLSDSLASDDLISELASDGFLDKGAAEASDLTGRATHSTGKLWEALLAAGADYPAVIKIEMESSQRSFAILMYIFIGLEALIFFVECLFFPIPYAIISMTLFVIAGSIPLPVPGSRRAHSELAALSWLVHRFYKDDPEACAKSLAGWDRVRHLFAAVARLDARGKAFTPGAWDRFLAAEAMSLPGSGHDWSGAGVSPAALRHAFSAFASMWPAEREAFMTAASRPADVPAHNIEEVVALLLGAGLGAGGAMSKPGFWKRGAAVANDLMRWLYQNPTSTPEARVVQARRLVDENHLYAGVTIGGSFEG